MRGGAGAGTAAVPTTIPAGRLQQGIGAIWLAAHPSPAPVSPLAVVSCGGWAAPGGQAACVRFTAAVGSKVNRSGQGPLGVGSWRALRGYRSLDKQCSPGLPPRLLLCSGGGGGPPAATPVASGGRESRSAAAAVPPAAPPTPHCHVGTLAIARAAPLPQKGPRAIASRRGALVGCGRIDTLQPIRGSRPWCLPKGAAAGAGTAAVATAAGTWCVRQGAGARGRAVPPLPVSHCPCFGLCQRDQHRSAAPCRL